MGKRTKVWDGTDPGATPGRAFTADIGQEEIIQQGKFLDFLMLGYKAAISTAAVAVEAGAANLAEYVVRIGGQERIVLNLLELVALMKAYYKEKVIFGENTDNTGNNFIAGVKIPIQTVMDPAKPVTHAASFATVTNTGTQTLGISAEWKDDAGNKKPIHAVRIALTSAAAAGYQELSSRIAPLGKLRYLIVKNTTGFNDGNIDVSIQRIRIKLNGELYAQYNALTDVKEIATIDLVTASVEGDLYKDYLVFDCGEDGIDVKSKEATIEFDVQDTSDAVVFIPVIEME